MFASMTRTAVLATVFAALAIPLAGCGDEAPSDGEALAIGATPDADEDLLPVEVSPETDLLPVSPTPDPDDDLLPVVPPPETAPEAPPETTPETMPRGVTDDVACLEGTWELKADDFVQQLNEYTGGAGTVEFGGGRYIVEFADDGTYVSRREGFTIRIVTPEGTIVSTTDSIGSGKYTVNDVVPSDFEGEITIIDDVDEATVSLSLEMGGVIVPMPEGIPMTFDVPTAGLGGTTKYLCWFGEELVTGLRLDDGSLILTQFVRL